ncbi:MAG: ATP-dependent Clp protease ATP-binding subunit [Bacteroidaceae bacterium]|nr:ATP-dependent Clp protease ATP-binding subunit [Bacteroidaceae bacterium]
MTEDIIRIAQSFAEDYTSDAIYPAHLLKAVLHKEAGLIGFVETTLGKDYFYLQEWADIQMQLCPRAMKPKANLSLSDEGKAVEEEAENYNERMGLDANSPVGLLAALATPGVGFQFDQLKTFPLTADEVVKAASTPDANKKNKAAKTSASPVAKLMGTEGNIEKYCIDKLAQIENGEIDAVVGFENEIATIIETLGRRTKPNMLITGEAGVGKTSLVNGFCLQMAEGNVPTYLQDAKIYQLDNAALGSDASYKGEVEDRFKKLMAEIKAQDNAVLVIEQIDKLFEKNGTLCGAGEILKQELQGNGLLLLATASIDGYTKNMETDKELVTKLQRLTVDEPDKDQALKILIGAMPAYEEFHGLKVNEEVMSDAIRLAKRYLTEKALPDSAIDLLDRTMAQVKAANDQAETPVTELTGANLDAVVAKITGVPLGKVQTKERDRLLGAEDTLKKRVIGQDHAVKKVLDSVFESRSGLNKKGQPMGSFFFLGPTGTGKTELSKALAEFLFGDESALIRFDMSEFKEEHSVALLYGAPPGYVGYEEGGLLVNKIRQKPYSVVLFDEIEKAHKSVFDLFLQILDEGKLHDRLGRVGDFSNALLLFTSNIGSSFIVDKFNNGVVPENNDLMDIMQDYFRPEFLGRLTEIVPFAPISAETVTRIFDVHLKGLLSLLNEQGITLNMPEDVKQQIAMKGFNPQYGARPIIGIIRKQLRHPLSKLIISGQIKGGDTVTVSIGEDGEPKFEV